MNTHAHTHTLTSQGSDDHSYMYNLISNGIVHREECNYVTVAASHGVPSVLVMLHCCQPLRALQLATLAVNFKDPSLD